jgi:hypothetical protein
MFSLKMAYNVCAYAVAGIGAQINDDRNDLRDPLRHCPGHRTLGEDNFFSLHYTPPLHKHFVAGSLQINLF